MKKNILFLSFFLLNMCLFSQTYLINKNYCIVTSNAYLIVNGHLNNESNGNLNLTGANSNVIVQNNLTNNGSINSYGIIDLYGDWINNSTCTHNNTSYVYLKGANQTIGGNASTTFYNLYLEGTGTKTLGINQTVDGTLDLKDRELATQSYTMNVSNASTSAIQRTTGFVSSTVGGGLARSTNSTSTYLYPVGVSGKYRPAEITPSSTSSATFKVRMANGDATSEGYNRNNKAADVCDVNSSFFHIMQRTSGSINANIKVYYDNSTDGSWDKVGYWSSNLWNNYSGSSTSSGSPLYYGSANNVNLASSTPIALTKNAPIITASASPSSICVGESTILTVTGADNYTWSNGMNSATITVTPSNTTSYTVTGYSGGCTGTAIVTVTVNQLPTISLTANPNTLCLGSSSVLTATGADTYNWSHGIGSSGSTITVTPTENTTYIVTGTSTEGCTNTATITIAVNPIPNVTAFANPNNICIGGSSTLSASGANTYNWSNGMSGASITVTPNSTTTYTVTGMSTAGCTNTTTVTVIISTTIDVTANANPSSICEGASSILNAGGGDTYTWSNGMNSATITVTPSNTTSYTVTGYSGGCTGTAIVTVTVNQLPTISLTANPNTLCLGSSSVLTATGADTYNWSHGIGSSGSTITVTPTGNITYIVTGTSTEGCTNTASVSITVNPNPTINITCAQTTICKGESVILNAIGADNYSWSHGMGSNATITVTPNNTTTYSVTGTNEYGCTNSANITITVLPNADATIKPVTPLCDNLSTITLNATDSGGVWSGNGIINQVLGTFSPSLAGAGTHIITYMIMGQCGDTATTEVIVYESPTAIAYATDETCIDANDGIAWVITTGGTAPYTYLWSNNYILDTITNLAPGEYYVTVRDFHNCFDTDTVIIKEGTEDCYITHVYVPNIFSPNDKDNPENEYLMVYGKGIKTIDFKIFDRWGNEVFHTTDVNEGWDGTYKGKPALVGDYTYILKVSFISKPDEILKGHIYLIR